MSDPSATFIDYLRSRFVHDVTVGIAYFYCKYHDEASQGTANLIAASLRDYFNGNPPSRSLFKSFMTVMLAAALALLLAK